MSTKKQLGWLVNYVSLQKSLWEALCLAHDISETEELSRIPRSGEVASGGIWKYAVHGNGVIFSEKNGGRRVDLCDVEQGAEQIDSWRKRSVDWPLKPPIRLVYEFINRIPRESSLPPYKPGPLRQSCEATTRTKPHKSTPAATSDKHGLRVHKPYRIGATLATS